MLIDQYIAMLQKLRDDHGPDLKVTKANGTGAFKQAALPVVRHEHKNIRRHYWVPDHDLDLAKGEKVVQV